MGVWRALGPWWGKLCAAAAGFWLGGWAGLFLGLVLGHLFDQRLRLAPFSPKVWEGSSYSPRERVLFAAVFSLMGHVAKADGRVSEQEVAATETVMRELGLEGRWRTVAITLFRRGKRADFPLRAVLQRLQPQLRDDRALAERVLGYQLRIAHADGAPDPLQLDLLRQAALLLRLSPEHLERLLASRSERAARGARSLRPPLQSAYAVLGVSERADDDEIKRAYRRNVSRHHPDRMVAKGASEEELREAARRTQEIRAAFEEIRRLRGF